MGPVFVPIALPQEVGTGRGKRGFSLDTVNQALRAAAGPSSVPHCEIQHSRRLPEAPFPCPCHGDGWRGSLHLPGSNFPHSMALWPVAAPSLQHFLSPPPSPYIWPVPGLSLPPPRRCLTAALASSARCVSRAPGGWVVCVRATGSARTGSWAVGSATAARASMEQPVRCASWAATGPPALESATVPTGYARRDSEGMEVVSVMWAGRAPAVTRRSPALNAQRSVIPMPTAYRSRLQPRPVSVLRGTQATASTVQVQSYTDAPGPHPEIFSRFPCGALPLQSL